MNRALIIAAAVVGIVAVLDFLASYTHFGDRHERAGHFDIYTNPKVADLSVSSALYYKRHLLTERVHGYAVDPNNPDRILFSSDDVFHGTDGLCGTFLYDGQSRQLNRLRRWPYAARLWSPDSRFILLDRATVHNLLTDEEIALENSVSRQNGSRVPGLQILQWSPDSQRVAAVISISPDGRERDLDLVEITLARVRVRYVATIRNSSLVWTDGQIRWSEGLLQVSALSTPDRKIMVKTPEELGWGTSAPATPADPPLHQSYCASVEQSSR